MNYSSIAWLPICAGLTAVGLVLSYLYGRRHGHLAMLRGAAWSLLPLAAWLTGSIEMFWKIGVAIGHFADGFVFSPVKWAGIGVAGISALLFLSTRGRGRRKAARLARRSARREREKEPAAPGGARAAGLAGTNPAGTKALDTLTLGTLTLDTQDRAPVPGKAAKPAKDAKPARPPKGGAKAAAGADDDLKDIDEILRKRGI